MQCFLDDFRHWLGNRSQEAVPHFGRDFPIKSNRKPALALSYFLLSSEGVLWQPYIGLQFEKAELGSIPTETVSLRFLAISADLRIRESATLAEANQSATSITRFAAELSERAPSSLGPAIAGAGGLWSWMRAQEALPKEAIGGAMRTAGACLLTVLLLTTSLPLTLLVAVAVLGATLSQLALLVANGASASSLPPSPFAQHLEAAVYSELDARFALRIHALLAVVIHLCLRRAVTSARSQFAPCRLGLGIDGGCASMCYSSAAHATRDSNCTCVCALPCQTKVRRPAARCARSVRLRACLGANSQRLVGNGMFTRPHVAVTTCH